MTRVHPRATILGGVAIGLTAGVALYSAISPSVVASSPTAFTLPKAPVALTHVTPAPANPAPCARGSRLVKGVCVVKVVRTVVVPAPAAAATPGSDQSAPGNNAISGDWAMSRNSAKAGNGSTAGYRAPTRTTSSAHVAPPSEQEDEHGGDNAKQDEDTGEDARHPGDHQDDPTDE